ncbi:MAG: 30S ribosomal protein S9 [Patescibacteria group bacterium]|nr:30S ribosomal protein S9 [Patescibacteria group bacterium]
MSKTRYIEGIGRRKEVVARVRLFKGTGRFLINNQKAENYFSDVIKSKEILNMPFVMTANVDKFDVFVKVYGGGKNAQVDAIILGLGRALLKMDETLKPTLRKNGFLTRDPRQKERKKPGLKGARKAPQWSKR